MGHRNSVEYETDMKYENKKESKNNEKRGNENNDNDNKRKE